MCVAPQPLRLAGFHPEKNLGALSYQHALLLNGLSVSCWDRNMYVHAYSTVCITSQLTSMA